MVETLKFNVSTISIDMKTPEQIIKLLQQVHLLMDLKKFTAAEKLLYSILRDDPNYSNALALLAICKHNTAQYNDAIKFANQSNHLNLNIRAITVLLLTHYNQGNYVDFCKTSEIGRTNFPMDYKFPYYEALFAKRLHRYKKAARLVEEALKLKPDSSALHNLKGEILELRGNIDSAKVAYDTSIKLSPNHPETHRNQGWYALRKGRTAEAIHFFQTSLRQTPQDVSSQRGYRLALKSEINWFRPFIRYIVFTSRVAPLIVVGVVAGFASQGGQLGKLMWNDHSAAVFMIIICTTIGTILFFRMPFALSAIVGLNMYKNKRHSNIFDAEQKAKDIRHLYLYGIGCLLFAIFLYFAYTGKVT